MGWIPLIFLLVPAALTIETQDGTQKVKPKDITNVFGGQFKDIPSSEISKILLKTDGKDTPVLAEKKTNIPAVTEIKPLETIVETKPKESTPAYVKKNKPEVKKWRSKKTKKQRNGLRKKKKLALKKWRKPLLNRKKQNQKRNKWVYRGKKQARNIQPKKLSEVIDSILNHHKKGEGSKLSSQQIRQQILALINSHKDGNKVIKAYKKCPKPKINIRKGRKRVLNRRKDLRNLNRSKNLPKVNGSKNLRNLNRNKTQQKGPKRGVAVKGNAKKWKKKGSKVPRKIIWIVRKNDKRLKGNTRKGNKEKKGKGKIKSNITIAVRNRKKSNSKKSQKSSKKSTENDS